MVWEVRIGNCDRAETAEQLRVVELLIIELGHVRGMIDKRIADCEAAARVHRAILADIEREEDA